MTHPRHCPYETKVYLNKITREYLSKEFRKILIVKKSRKHRKSEHRGRKI